MGWWGGHLQEQTRFREGTELKARPSWVTSVKVGTLKLTGNLQITEQAGERLFQAAQLV